MNHMFNECYSLKKIIIKNFNTNNAIDLSSIFEKCTSLKEFDFSNFIINKDTKITNMFKECPVKLISKFKSQNMKINI